MSTLFACHDGADPSPIESVYFDADTGEIFVFNQGQKIVVGGVSLPGLTSVGQNGVVVAGPFQAGDTNATVVPSINLFYGALTVHANDATNQDNDPPFNVSQFGPNSQDNYMPVAEFGRTDPGPHPFLEPIVVIADGTGVAGAILLAGIAGGVATGPSDPLVGGNYAFRFGAEGGLALYGKDPVPTAPRTLAQATINAITDANAKAAVQALANTLADMGALTLT